MRRYFGFFTAVVLVCLLVQPVLSASGEELYEKAMGIIEKLPSPYTYEEPLYNHDNIDNNLYIPQYRTDIQDYENDKDKSRIDAVSDEVLPLLKQAMELNSSEASVALADMYIFGNYSVSTNYTKALEYYHKAVSIEANGHAYFMLGFLYSTGAFGELAADQSKANLYYEFGMANGDTNSILALAYRNLVGIGVPVNCELALYYYTRLSHIGIDFLREQDEENEEDDLLYNIRLSDFNGGVYGSKVSEVVSSIFSTTKSYTSSRNTLNEYSLEVDHECVDYYYDALEYYDGDYFIPKNRTRAFEILKECAAYGETVYGLKNYRNANDINVLFLSRCQGLLGHMYLKGHGTNKNYDMALKWLNVSSNLKNTSETLNDLGLLHEGLIPDIQDTTTAISYYTGAIKHKSHEARLNLAKLLINISANKDVLLSPYREQIYENVQKAVYNGNTEALYYLGEFLQSGVAAAALPDRQYSCENTAIYYKIFVERLERYFMPHLKYAFDEFRFGNFKNALIGYLIAAEQGLENAQMSASYLLFQLQPLVLRSNKKTFTIQRIQSSIKYLERASSQNNVDATVLLGDLYLNGINGSNFSIDYGKAFKYFNKAAHQHSSHGCYNLAYMYEYGLGPTENSVDYFMAKRYYDLSLKYRDNTNRDANKIPINLALLRLRLKYLFNRKKFKGQSNNNGETTGWLNTFKKIGNNDKNDLESSEKANAKSQAHHEGKSYLDEDDYDIGDYLVIFLTFMFFVIFFVQNVYRQLRRMRNNQQNGDGNDQQDPQNNQGGQAQNGWNRNQFQFRRGNFEFQFFAL